MGSRGGKENRQTKKGKQREKRVVSSSSTKAPTNAPSANDIAKDEDPSRGSNSHWLTSLAILGDSWAALAASFSIFLLSIGFSLYLDKTSGRRGATVSAEQDAYNRLGPVPHLDPPTIFHANRRTNSSSIPFASISILRAYQKDGVVAVRGLISDDLLQALDRESARLVKPTRKGAEPRTKKRGTQFHTVLHSAIFRPAPDDEDTDNSADEKDSGAKLSAFWQVAVSSPVSNLAAELLHSTGELRGGPRRNGADDAEKDEINRAENLRVMRDIFLTKDDDEYACGWHVDDVGFWPATPEAPGVNAWIALDDMPVEYGGGFAVAVGSHEAPWRDEAHFVTGATFPPTGYTSAADMFANRTGSGTCNLKQSAPHLHRRMEETKRIYPVRRGDVIFHTRWLFHRTVPFERSYVSQQKPEDKPLIYRRYSVRYSPGSATVPPGYGTELSVLWDEANGGRSADEVSERDGPWYPQAWPETLQSELDGLVVLTKNKIPVAEERRAARVQEMQPFLKLLSKNQRRGKDRPH